MVAGNGDPRAARAEVTRHLRASSDALADAVIVRVQADAPAGATPDGATLRNLRLGAHAAVEYFLARLDASAWTGSDAGDRDESGRGTGDSGADCGGTGGAGTGGAGTDCGGTGGAGYDTALFEAHGRAQQAAGRSLSELLAFYRLGGLAMWEGAQALPISRDLAPEAIFALGAEVLATVDALSVAALAGFTAQEAETLRRELARRERLASLLLSDRPSAPEALAAAAAAADWSLPARVRVAVAALPIEPPPGAALAGPARVLAATVDGGRRALVVADDDEGERWLTRAAQAQQLEPPLAVGPAVEPEHAARSLARAEALLDRADVLRPVALSPSTAPDAAAAPDPDAAPFALLRCDDHEIDLLLSAAPELARAVAQRRLTPFDTLPERQRERLLETLAGWLAHPVRPQAIADELGVHVQTVRYRLNQLRELLGDALDDPEARFELSVALRARALNGDE
ncbi:PucR family transcriptional regulator [Conexibacter woesei]|uniref:Transcriptional regulator, CdaR n=1 Tax=Conexibacter woesei (strain DSM 14684 / CCUG 47730 / CIP 108061 / JCM 11494 / NBRC 100937 / ID131577) TaxID=469383 RepID=D3F806_CONWI|nr:helix-turn-helix domain-containing protein [Conexibacter woesei]ADB52900.1 transcriptional regulator, CdaR [Conexibacter woesei DSM 14684]